MRDVGEVRKNVEQAYGGKAKLLQSVPVREEVEGKVVWNDVVHVFEVEAQHDLIRVYAGSLPAEAGAKGRVFVLRHANTVASPIAAVRAAILMEQRRQRPLL